MTIEKPKTTVGQVLGVACPNCGADRWRKNPNMDTYYRCERCLGETSLRDLMELKAAIESTSAPGAGGIPGSGVE